MMNSRIFVKLIIFLLCVSAPMSLTCSNALAEAKKKPAKSTKATKSPSDAVKNYINAYLKRTWPEMFLSDAGMASNINNITNRAYRVQYALLTGSGSARYCVVPTKGVTPNGN